MKKMTIIILCTFLCFGCQGKPKPELSLTFYDVKTIEYGEEFNSKDLIKDCVGTIETYPSVDTKVIGKQVLIFEVVDKEEKKNFEYEIEVIDTKKPIIELTNEKVSIDFQAKFNPLAYVKNIQDNVDGKLEYKKEEDVKTGEAYYTYQNLVNTNKAGTYDVHYKAIDKSGNESQQTLKVSVKEEKKVAVVKTPPKETTPPKQEVSTVPQQSQYNYVLESTVASMKAASQVNQMVIVTATSSSTYRGTLQYFVKNGEAWVEKLKVKCNIGQAGMGVGKESSTKTPVGSYTFTHAYGIKGNPGSAMSYTQINNNHYWCGDQYYNQFVDASVTDHSLCSVNKDEHLIDYPGVYNYFASYNYNASNVVGRGFAYFLHCTNSQYNFTEGCIAVSESDIIYLLKNINTSTRLVISPIQDINKY